MGRIFVLIGRSAVGKSTVEKELEKIGYKRIISNTTRPMRKGEIDGVDYHFITEEKFQEMKDSNELYESTTYNNWHYCISKHNVPNIDKEDYIVVTEPNGFKQLVETLGTDKVIPIYLYLSPYKRLNFAINREPNADDSVYKEICRRFISDYDTFGEIEKQNICKIENTNIVNTVMLIVKYINSGYYLYYQIPQEFQVWDKVKVVKINDTDEATHLMKYIGQIGYVKSWLRIKENEPKRYKVLFVNEETAYFRHNEIEKVD